MSNTTTDLDAGTRAPFVVFEGVEGAGKSTQIERVAERLRGSGVPFLLAREPGGTAVGERIREVVLDGGLEMSAEAELLLVLAARAEFVRRLVRPALASGKLVLADRYELSTFAYQGGGRELGIDRVRGLNAFATEGLAPDLTILLLVAPDLGRGRQSGEPDRLEREDAAFHQRVAVAYEELAATDESVVVVRTEVAPDQVHEQIWDELARRWPERFGGGRAGNFLSESEFHEQDGSAFRGPNIDAGEEVE